MGKGNLWKKMKDAKEEEFFRDRNKAALQRIAKRETEETPRNSPVTGEEMAKKTIMGVVVDVCPETGGIWFDGGELEQILHQAEEFDDSGEFLSDFLKALSK